MRPILRVLITGSREWDDRETIYTILKALPPGSVIVHGDADGADSIAAVLGESMGHMPEPHPVSKETWKRVGPAAGPLRNQRMVDLGADLCLAFPRSGSRGTWDTIRRARKAKIKHVIVLGQYDVPKAVSAIHDILKSGSFLGWTI
jgi:alkylated DNA nucleotide flippase Atl1